MNNVEQKLKQIRIDGFDEEIMEIRNLLKNLDSFEKAHQLMNSLDDKIQSYKNECNLLEEEFDQLPLDFIDEHKQNKIQHLLSSPKTINQARNWIKNIQKYIDKRVRICFPKELTQYTDVYLIGTGGFSRVYKVKNIKKNRIAAVKIPIKKDANIGKSFLRELNNWVKLKHHNIVEIYQYNILPVPYIEMEWCDSCLEDIQKPVQFNLALHYIHGIAEGLQYAHKHNIAHFDLKPQNILLKDYIPKITDWGLSRLITLQGTTTIGISLPFAAPEQFSTKYGKKDEKTDIWQLGILFYHLLTNKIPFSGADFAEYGKNITSKNIKKLILKDESIEDVSHILIKCLSRQKKNRYKNVDRFLDDIEEIM
jgi:serine/threonine protein kinase